MPPVYKINLYRTTNNTEDTPMHKPNHYRTTSVLKKHPVHKIKQSKTIIIPEDTYVNM